WSVGAARCVPNPASLAWVAGGCEEAGVVVNRIAGVILCALVSPAFGIVAALVRVLDGRPVLFAQERAGFGGRPFRVLKFRTMRAPAVAGEADEDRITALGRVLRASSLDELPSLWNVARGEMALVGPRPLPMAYVERYSPAQGRRLEVKPGLTGVVQTRGRNALSWDEKFDLDTWYVENRSWRLDWRLILETPFAVLRARGISHPGHATMPVFEGAVGSWEGTGTT
ncbi:MAG: sugar transferase, partial [Acidimicrobiales bacterium]